MTVLNSLANFYIKYTCMYIIYVHAYIHYKMYAHESKTVEM